MEGADVAAGLGYDFPVLAGHACSAQGDFLLAQAYGGREVRAVEFLRVADKGFVALFPDVCQNVPDTRFHVRGAGVAAFLQPLTLGCPFAFTLQIDDATYCHD